MEILAQAVSSLFKKSIELFRLKKQMKSTSDERHMEIIRRKIQREIMSNVKFAISSWSSD